MGARAKSRLCVGVKPHYERGSEMEHVSRRESFANHVSPSRRATAICEWLQVNQCAVTLSLCLFAVLFTAGLTICLAFMNSREREIINEALDIATDTGEWFSDQLDRAILPLFSMAQFAVELEMFRSLPSQIGPAREPGSLPLLPPRDEGGAATHRNVTGVCDEPELVKRFSSIAASIKQHAKMEGILVNIQLAPQAVVCLLYPLVNTEDFDNGVVMNNTGARGLDLLTDPNSSFIAKASIPQDDVIIAGPLTLRQCSGGTCDATVERAFIARLPISVPDNDIIVDGVPYKKWGFATALINWEALVERSDIYQTFLDRKMTFRLTRTDRTYDIEADAYVETVVLLAESPDFKACENSVSTALQTTDNEWEIVVAYDATSLNNSKTAIIVAVVVMSFLIAVMAFAVLQQRRLQQEMLGRTLTQDARVATERNITAYFAHELRNPLGAIDSALAAMPDDLPDSSKELVSGMVLCTSFMSNIMNNLLDVRKMEEGKMTLEKVPMSLSRVTGLVQAMLLSSLHEGVEFVCVSETEGNDWVSSDIHRIQQVMTNITTNAIKHTSQGSITLRVSWEGEFVKFECSDTGPGIPKEEQEQMFERFVQGGGTPGSGLGLAISKHIVTLLGGSIKFESDPAIKPGTNCVVLLPLRPCDEPQPTKIVNAEEFKPITEEIRFLIVDDVKMNQQMLQRRIKKGIAPNCLITAASTGEEALEICGKIHFDVIIMDQYMEAAGGQLLGTEVVVIMRQQMRVDSIIIGSSGNEIDAEFLRAGADWVWQKPIPPNKVIIPRLRQALKNRRVCKSY